MDFTQNRTCVYRARNALTISSGYWTMAPQSFAISVISAVSCRMSCSTTGGSNFRRDCGTPFGVQSPDSNPGCAAPRRPWALLYNPVGVFGTLFCNGVSSRTGTFTRQPVPSRSGGCVLPHLETILWEARSRSSRFRLRSHLP